MFQMNTVHTAMHPPCVTHDCALVSLLEDLDLGPTGTDLTIVVFLYSTDQQVVYYYLLFLQHERFHLR